MDVVGFYVSQTCATTRPVFIAKLKLNRIFTWLYKTFLFGCVFGIKCFFLRGVLFQAAACYFELRLCMQYMLHVHIPHVTLVDSVAYCQLLLVLLLLLLLLLLLWSFNTDRNSRAWWDYECKNAKRTMKHTLSGEIYAPLGEHFSCVFSCWTFFFLSSIQLLPYPMHSSKEFCSHFWFMLGNSYFIII